MVNQKKKKKKNGINVLGAGSNYNKAYVTGK